MTQAIVTGYHHGSDAAMLPEVNIRSADSRGTNMDQAVVRTNRRDLALYQAEVMARIGFDGVVLWLRLENVHLELSKLALPTAAEYRYL